MKRFIALLLAGVLLPVYAPVSVSGADFTDAQAARLAYELREAVSGYQELPDVTGSAGSSAARPASGASDEGVPPASSTGSRSDAADPEIYSALGLDTTDPAAFTASGDPLAGYETMKFSQLYIAEMNRSGHFEGSRRVMESLFDTSAAKESADGEVMYYGFDPGKFSFAHPKTDVLAKKDFHKFDAEAMEYQLHNAHAFDPDGDGIDGVVSVTLYTGIMQDVGDYNGEHVSRLLLDYHEYDGSGELVQAVNPLILALADEDSKDPRFVWNIDTISSGAYTPIAVGNFNNNPEGRQQVAIYVPSKHYDPYIMVYELKNGGWHSTYMNIDMREILYQYSIDCIKDYKEHYMPVVSLATTSISGKDELVVSVCMPYNDTYKDVTDEFGNPIDMRGQTRIYGFNPGSNPDFGTLESRLSIYFDDSFMSAGKSYYQSARFISATDTDLNGNGVKELLLAGYRELRDTDKEVKFNERGDLDEDYNLVHLVTWNSDKNEYETVWSYPKTVPAHSKQKFFINAGRDGHIPPMEPVALASGTFRFGSRRHDIFLEGVMLQLTGDTPANGSEKSCYTNASFFKNGEMDRTDNSKYNINKAVSGFFTRNCAGAGLGAMQMCVISSEWDAVDESDFGFVHDWKYYVYFDVTWVYYDESQHKYIFTRTDDNYFSKRFLNNYGTFLNICALDMTGQSLTYKYTGRTFGWSAPRPLALLYGPPYWEELPYGDSTVARGNTSITLTNTQTEGRTNAFEIGGGYSLNVSAGGTGGAFVASVNSMLGLEIGITAAYTHSYTENLSTTSSLTITNDPRQDTVAMMATPTVVYEYDMRFPGGPVTQQMIDAYKEVYGKDPDFRLNDVIEPQDIPIQIVAHYNPVFGKCSLIEYNKIAQLDENVPELDTSKIFPHTKGDPTTFPQSENELKQKINASGGVYISDDTAISSNSSASTTTMSYARNKAETWSDGYRVGLSGAFLVNNTFSAGIPLIAEGKVQVNQRFSVNGSNSQNWQHGNTKGVTFSSTIVDLPLPAGYKDRTDYNFSAKLAVWQDNTINAAYDEIFGEDSGVLENDGLVVLGYIVNSNSPDTAPPALPKDFRVYSATTDSLTLAWKEAVRQPAADGYYDIERRIDGNFIPLTDYTNRVRRGQTMFTEYDMARLGRGPHEYQVTAVSGDTRHNSIPSAPPVSGRLAPDPSAVYIKTQPVSTLPDASGNVTFTAEAEGEGTIAYQWQRYMTAQGNLTSDWKDIESEAAKRASYTFKPTDEEKAGAYYRCMVTNITAGATVISREVRIAANDPVLLSESSIYAGIFAEEREMTPALPVAAIQTDTSVTLTKQELTTLAATGEPLAVFTDNGIFRIGHAQLEELAKTVSSSFTLTCEPIGGANVKRKDKVVTLKDTALLIAAVIDGVKDCHIPVQFFVPVPDANIDNSQVLNIPPEQIGGAVSPDGGGAVVFNMSFYDIPLNINGEIFYTHSIGFFLARSGIYMPISETEADILVKGGGVTRDGDDPVRSGWVETNGFWYYYENNNPVTNSWRKWNVNGAWYYLGADGRMHTGWLWDDVLQSWFYLSIPNGAMLQNCWVRSGDNWYYLKQGGYMAAGEWIEWYGNKYYLSAEDPIGHMLAGGKYTIDGEEFEFDDNGALITE